MAKKKDENEIKNRVIRVRLTEQSYIKAQRYADQCGVTISEYMRRVAERRKIVSRVEQNVVNELRRLGGLLKHVHTESGGAYSEDTANLIRLMQRFILELIGHDRKSNR